MKKMRFFIFIFCLLLNSIHVFADNDSKSIKRDAVAPILIDTKDCGTKKNCFISPNDCDVDNNKCVYVLKWDFDGHYINYELNAVVKGWISVLFSEDQKLGNDNLVTCKYDDRPLSNDVVITHYHLDIKPGDKEPHLTKLPISRIADGDGLSKTGGSFKDGIINCKFSRTRTSGVELVNNLNKGHFIHVGTGLTGELIDANLLRNFRPTDKAIEFYTVNKFHEPTHWLVKFHAIFMIIAWIFLSSLGILIARYYKPLWPNHALFKLRVWFSFHRSLMLTVAILTILSFLLILIHMRFTWSLDGMEFVHSILGIIIICLVCINPILGLCRPKPDTKLRCVYFWFHWLIGTIAYCLSVPQVFIGMDLRKIDLPNWCSWVLFFWVLFHIIVEIILEVHYCCTFHKHTERYHEYTLVDKNQVIDKRRNPPGYRWKPTLLFIYAAVTAIVVSALVIAVLIKDLV